jgi:RNA polymerase sigma-70 factor (ECF subfamily)
LEERQRRAERLDGFDPDLVPDRSRTEFETTESLERALGMLPLEQRSVLVLREIDGLTYREIAETLSIPIGTVMSRLARARERLLGVGAGARFGRGPSKVDAAVETIDERRP